MTENPWQTDYFPEPINGDFYKKHLIDINQLGVSDFLKIFHYSSLMRDIAQNSIKTLTLAGIHGVLLFFENSARTMSSFDVATQQQSGTTTVYVNPTPSDILVYSSQSKGESFEDTIDTFASKSDFVVIRHPRLGAAGRAAKVIDQRYSIDDGISIINAGDGSGQHPTQAILDLYTIYERFGRLDNLKLLFAGDNKYSRTVHSLLQGLSLWPHNEVILYSPEILRPDQNFLNSLRIQGMKIDEIFSHSDIPRNRDVWYWTRVQTERGDTAEQIEQLKQIDKPRVTKHLLSDFAKDKMILMHPMPIVDEIAPEVYSDKRAVFRTNQNRNGDYTRMALLSLLTGRLR